MTVLELIEQLRQLVDAGHGDAIVCLPDSDETACAGDMEALRQVIPAKFQALASGDAVNGDPAILLI